MRKSRCSCSQVEWEGTRQGTGSVHAALRDLGVVKVTWAQDCWQGLAQLDVTSGKRPLAKGPRWSLSWIQ